MDTLVVCHPLCLENPKQPAGGPPFPMAPVHRLARDLVVVTFGPADMCSIGVRETRGTGKDGGKNTKSQKKNKETPPKTNMIGWKIYFFQWEIHKYIFIHDGFSSQSC